MPMIQYWKYKESVDAKVMRGKDGSLIMRMAGEKEDFPGFPRGHLLFGKLSKLKHEIKNRIFNHAWQKLEEKTPEKEVAEEIARTLKDLYALAEETKYDRIPPEKMCAPVREIYRAWTKVSPQTKELRDMLVFILQEDDGYRFRVQWLAAYFNPNGWLFRLLRKDIIAQFAKALTMLERGEVVGDMKAKERLLKRVLMAYVKHSPSFIAFCKEVDWKKVALSKADKFHFRGKYFKVDLDLFDY